jgi:hypothetical protein
MKVVLYQGALYSVLTAIQVIVITVKLLQSQCTPLKPRLFMFLDYTYTMMCQSVKHTRDNRWQHGWSTIQFPATYFRRLKWT